MAPFRINTVGYSRYLWMASTAESPLFLFVFLAFSLRETSLEFVATLRCCERTDFSGASICFLAKRVTLFPLALVTVAIGTFTTIEALGVAPLFLFGPFFTVFLLLLLLLLLLLCDEESDG